MRFKKGIVTSNKQTKTLVVSVTTYKNHPKYKKRYLVSKKFHVHNPKDEKIELGKEITFYETRPLSKLKRWTTEQPETPNPKSK
ncbi:mitochondrial small ribosomal subunit protein uS17m [Candidatus Peregrinibacteria bacterium]|nr:mitochondrial small ribosomal subunit protein uS17m [Candidatus Peregrinibacteria bacterium]